MGNHCLLTCDTQTHHASRLIEKQAHPHVIAALPESLPHVSSLGLGLGTGTSPTSSQ